MGVCSGIPGILYAHIYIYIYMHIESRDHLTRLSSTPGNPGKLAEYRQRCGCPTYRKSGHVLEGQCRTANTTG